MPENDPSTLFICSGMQPLKPLFENPDGSGYGNVQHCVRTNDIELVGDPVSRDHFRTLSVFWEQGIQPGNKGRNYVCRRLMRRFVRLNPSGSGLPFQDWFGSEKTRLERSVRDGRRHKRRNPGTTPQFYWETYGVLPEEMELL